MYPFLVGLAGLVALPPSFTVWELTAVPLFELNVTVYFFVAGVGGFVELLLLLLLPLLLLLLLNNPFSNY